MTTEEKISAAIEALREIVNPIEFMILRLGDDELLDGAGAIRLSKDLYYLRQIAIDCLDRITSAEPSSFQADYNIRTVKESLSWSWRGWMQAPTTNASPRSPVFW